MKLDTPMKTVHSVNVKPLQRRLAEIPEAVWNVKTFRQERADAQKDTQSIILCWSGFSTASDAEFGSDAFVTNKWTAEYQYFKDVMDPINNLITGIYSKRVIRSMLTRLHPGGTIPVHRDIDPTFTASHRIHVPIVTHPDVEFRIAGQRHQFHEGVVYEFDNLEEHSVHNPTKFERVHLIMDILTEDMGLMGAALKMAGVRTTPLS